MPSGKEKGEDRCRGEASEFEQVVEKYRKRFGHYPERILADKIYRSKSNRAFCKEHGIHLSGPRLGRPGKDHSEELLQELKEIGERNEVEDNLWSLLLMTGYLTKADPDAEGSPVELRIPNKEISNIFEETVVQYFNDSLARDRSKQKELMEALWKGDEETASRRMTDILFDTISYHDYHENYYHAFLTGIISGLGYAVRSNQENGLGRSDIAVRDRLNRRGMLLEAKKSDRMEDMEKNALEGKQQIINRDYLRGFEGFDSVVCYGISFFQKKALIRRLEI